MSDGIGKAEGFRDETYLIVPTESFAEYMEHPLVRGAYLTDVGFFPKAREHYREREEGADQYILIYCTAGRMPFVFPGTGGTATMRMRKSRGASSGCILKVRRFLIIRSRSAGSCILPHAPATTG